MIASADTFQSRFQLSSLFRYHLVFLSAKKRG
jgi:hypothetical protein